MIVLVVHLGGVSHLRAFDIWMGIDPDYFQVSMDSFDSADGSRCNGVVPPNSEQEIFPVF